MEIKKVTRLALFLSLSIVLSIVESLIPLFNGVIPGLKIGLANIVIMLTLYQYGFKEALFISLSRIFIVGILRTGLFSITFFFSLSGALLSILMMSLAKKTKLFSIIGVSIIGSIFHTLGQIGIAFLLVKNVNILYYLPWLALFSIPTGVLIGVLSKQLLLKMQK